MVRQPSYTPIVLLAVLILAGACLLGMLLDDKFDAAPSQGRAGAASPSSVGRQREIDAANWEQTTQNLILLLLVSATALVLLGFLALIVFVGVSVRRAAVETRVIEKESEARVSALYGGLPYRNTASRTNWERGNRPVSAGLVAGNVPPRGDGGKGNGSGNPTLPEAY